MGKLGGAPVPAPSGPSSVSDGGDNVVDTELAEGQEGTEGTEGSQDDAEGLEDASLADEPEGDAAADDEAAEDGAEGGDDAEFADEGHESESGVRLPEGFSSIEQYSRYLLDAGARRAQQQFAQQQQQAQQAQQQPQQPQGFQWQPPTDLGDPQTLAAVQLLRSDPEKFNEQLQHHPELKQRAIQADDYLQRNWQRWTNDPRAFVQEMVQPQVEPAIYGVQRELAELKAQRFREENRDVFDDPAATDEYLRAARSAPNAPRDLVLDYVRRGAELRRIQRERGDRRRESRDKQARSKSARGRQPNKSRPTNRSGSPKLALSKKDRADPKAIARAVMEQDFREGGGA